MNDIIDDGGRVLVTSDGSRRIAPFNNVKHHAKLRVKDFYPHRLRDFAMYDPQSNGRAWQWSFWLVLTSADKSDDPKQSINVLVHGQDADELLQLQADESVLTRHDVEYVALTS